MSDSLRSIWQSAARFFSGTILSRITGMLRDVAMAYAFGTQGAVAALLVAFRFAHLLRRLLGEGAMQTALIPHFEELRKDSTQKAGQFFCDLSSSLTVLLIVLVGFTMAGLGGLLSLDFFNPGNAQIAWLTLCMMPSLLFICLFGINASLLQCEKSYFVSSAAPVFFNIVWIVGVLMTAHLEINSAMSGLSGFIIIACFAQWAVTLPKVYKYLALYGRTSLWKGTIVFSKDVKALAKPLALGLLGVGAAQINNACDAIFARWADDEGPAYLWYAIRLQQLPLALFGIAISGALLPPLTRAIKNGQFSLYQQFLTSTTQRTLLLMIPMSALLLILGHHCVGFIYGRGDFSAVSIIGTTYSLWGYTVGLIPMALILILAPAFYAKNDYRTPAIASTVSMVINIALNTLMVASFHWGAASIALGTSISAWINLGWLIIALLKREPMLTYWKPIANDIWLMSLAAVVGISGVLFAEQMIWSNYSFWDIWNGSFKSERLSFMHEVVHLIVDGTIFCVLFGSIMFRKIMLKKQEI